VTSGRERLAPVLLAGLALLGLAVSSYLTYSHWGDESIVCAGIGDCDYVNSSDYATVGGLPVSLLGAGLYVGLLAAALLWGARPSDERFPIAFWGLSVAGVGYAAYLTYVELFVLEAICVWCVVSAVILVASLLVSTALLLLAEPD
jgi:uncharacterized membrane protein